jgi:hypothetical protein
MREKKNHRKFSLMGFFMGLLTGVKSHLNPMGFYDQR